MAILTVNKVQNFVWKNIVYRFEIPRVIISDNGRKFDSYKFIDFCRELGVKKPLLIAKASTSEWSDTSYELYFAQDHQSLT